MTVLRPLRWWDIEAVAALERRLFPLDPWSTEMFWAELAQGEARHAVVAEADDRVQGYAVLGAHAAEADLLTIAVDTDAQGRGIGRALLGEVVAEAWRRDCTAVLLEVRADNPGAQRLYRHCGFEQIAVRRGYYPGPVDALVLRLRRHVAHGSGAP